MGGWVDVGLGRVGGWVGGGGGGRGWGFFPIVLDKNHVWSWRGGGIGGWVAGRMWDWGRILYAFGFGGLGWRQDVIFCVRVGSWVVLFSDEHETCGVLNVRTKMFGREGLGDGCVVCFCCSCWRGGWGGGVGRGRIFFTSFIHEHDCF